MPVKAVQNLHPQMFIAGQLLVFCAANALNGGLIGAIGPTLPDMQAHTGMGTSLLGRAVTINRIAKLVGSLVWMAFAKSIEAGHPPILPRHALALSALLVTVSAFLLAQIRTNPLVVQGALALGGAACEPQDLDLRAAKPCARGLTRAFASSVFLQMASQTPA